MDLTAIQASVYRRIQESSENTAFSTTIVNDYINEGYRYVWTFQNTPWEWLIDETYKVNPYTNIADDSTDTTAYVDAVTNMFANQWLTINNGTVYERAKISGTPATTLTLASPGLVETYEDGDEVSSNMLALPTDYFNMLDVICEDISSGLQTTMRLIKADEEEIDRLYPRITDGVPTHYYVRNGYLYIYPVPDKAYKFELKYFKKPTALSESTDEPIFPSEYHDLLVYYTAGQILMGDVRGNGKMSNTIGQNYMQKFYTRLDEMRRNQLSKPNDVLCFRLASDETLPDR